MIVYWCGCFASVFIALAGCASQKGQKHRRAVVFFSALPLMLISALRYDVGWDYMATYMPYFDLVKYGMDTDATRMEPLFHLINEAAVWLGGDYGFVFVFALSAVLFMMLVFSQIFRDSPYPALSIFLLVAMGYYFGSFNAMRQMVGSAIMLFSVRYIEQRKPWPFLLCALAAAGFHMSNLVFVVMYWIGRMRIRPAAAFTLTAAVIALKPIITQLLNFIISLTRYGIYLSSVFSEMDTAYVMLAINVVLLVFASVCYRSEPDFRIYYNIQILVVWIIAYGGDVTLFIRLLWLFGLPSMIMLPKAIAVIPNERSRRLVIAAVVLLYFLYMSYTVGIQNSNNVLPYQTIFGRW